MEQHESYDSLAVYGTRPGSITHCYLVQTLNIAFLFVLFSTRNESDKNFKVIVSAIFSM